MTAQELQENRAELALLKAERTRRLLKGALRGVDNGTESIQREPTPFADLVDRIRELEGLIRLGEGRCFGALHVR